MKSWEEFEKERRRLAVMDRLQGHVGSKTTALDSDLVRDMHAPYN